jgi:N-acyl homoserine lactone hydrolase
MAAPGVELSVIRTGEIATPYGYVFRAGGNLLSRLRAGLTVGRDALDSPCLAFVVRHPSAGVIVIDTGFHEDTRGAFHKDFGVPMSLLFKGLRPASQSFDDQLRELRVEPESVRSVVMTHLHVDHTSGMRLLPNAQFTISVREWASARGRFAAARGYVPHHFPPEERVRLVDLERAGEPFGPFRRSLDLLGDGTMRLLSTPGHTKGHLSVLLRLVGGQMVMLVGDAAYTLRSIREGLLPMFTDNDETSQRSLQELKAFTEAEPEAIVVPSHDPDAWRALDDATAVSSSALA